MLQFGAKLLDAKNIDMLHTDRHFPVSFFSGNPSLREMVKDKGEFDRRLDDIDKRQRDFRTHI